jgi:hypothetical protein
MGWAIKMKINKKNIRLECAELGKMTREKDVGGEREIRMQRFMVI